MRWWEYYWQTYSVARYDDGYWRFPDEMSAQLAALGRDGWELVSMSVAPQIVAGGGHSTGIVTQVMQPIWLDVPSLVALAVFKRPRD